jgi:3-hydroxyisobutyrate dehydrogenase-like beta-hydroxyacid dehydrogenase
MTGQSGSVSWIGIGKMGLPITGRMVEMAVAVTGYDSERTRMDLAAGKGVKVVGSIDAAIEGQSIVFTSLPHDDALRAVVLADGGLLDKLSRGAILIETSTVSAEISAQIGMAAEQRGILYLRAPVSGNAAIAHTGNLTCFISGPRAAFDRVQPILASFTRAQTYLGQAEEARYAKLAVNLMIAVSAGMMAESLALARKGGIAWPDILKVLEDSAIASPMVKYKTPLLATRDFESTFSCRQMSKDLDLILDAGHEVGVSLQLAAQVREIYGSLVAQGDGEADFIATVRYVERLSGLGEPKLG